MLDSELNQYIAYSDFLLRVVRETLPSLIDTIKECSAGYPSGHEGGTEVDPETGEAVTYDSRTQSAALHPDPARDARKELERNTKALRSALVNLDGIRQAWLFTTSDKPTSDPDPGCESCKRLGLWSPRRAFPPPAPMGSADPLLGNTTDTKGADPRFGNLCQWCADWNRVEGQFPPKNVLEAHHQGKRITNALLDKLGVKTKATARGHRKAG